MQHPALSGGVFDVQQTAAIQANKFIQHLGTLNAEQMDVIEQTLAKALGLKLAKNPRSES